MTVISNSRVDQKRPPYRAAFPCAQCAVNIMASPAEALSAIEAHVNLWHPVVLTSGANPGARKVTRPTAVSLGITAGTPPG